MTKASIVAVGLGLALAATGAARAAEATSAGEKVFAKCQICHLVGEGAHNTVGPQLNGVVGRRAGSVQGYAYSPTLAASGLTWDEPTLRRFLKGPKMVVAGTKMMFPGLQSQADIDAVIGYLKSFGPDGTPVR